jgi:hypothetical protein
MPKIKSINEASPDMTSLQGYITTTYAKLVEKYGEPLKDDGYKSDAEWIIEWEDGAIGTIYNWKNGKNYLGNRGSEVEDITDWNIGGHKGTVVKRIRDDLLNSWPVFDEIRQEVAE